MYAAPPLTRRYAPTSPRKSLARRRQLLPRRHDVAFPADRRAGMPAEETLCRHRKLLGALAVLPHPGLTDRQPPVCRIADADEAEPLCLIKRGQSRRPEFSGREWRRMIRTIKRHRLAHFRGAGNHRPSRVEARMPGLRQFAGKLGARAVGPSALLIHPHLFPSAVWR